jgi:radical SAM protein with 4Fe4S-binding SPASM domain
MNDLVWIRNNIRNKRTTFLGGEPLLYPYLKYCIEVFPNVTLSTNGLLVEDNIDVLKGVSGVQLSLEGGQKETDFIRGEGVWDKVLKSARLLEKEGIEYYLRVSFWEGNLNGLREFDELGMPLVLFPRVDKPPLSEKMTSLLFEEVLKHIDWILALPNFLQYLDKPGRCKAGSERLNIMWDGKITPCNFDLDFFLGRVGDDLEQIENNIERYLKYTKVLPRECTGCKHSKVCHGSCYACNASAGCPLRYDFSISHFMSRYGVSGLEMKERVQATVSFLKRMLVC